MTSVQSPPEYRVPNTEYPIPSTQYRVPNTEYPVPNTQYPIPTLPNRRAAGVEVGFLLEGVGEAEGGVVAVEGADE